MGFFTRQHSHGETDAEKSKSKGKGKKRRVRFTDIAAERHTYDFDWEVDEPNYWFTRAELKTFGENRFDDAATLRAERGIKTASRNDADGLTTSRRDLFIGDKITHALDDVDDNHEISIRGIEHFVHPVLQKEMVGRKKELKAAVIGYSRDPARRRRDPKGLKLAEEVAAHSKWARDVASERGIKYCELKRGGGRGGGLLSVTHHMKARRGFSKSALGPLESADSRDEEEPGNGSGMQAPPRRGLQRV